MRVVLILVALAISGRSSTKKKSQSTNDEKRGNECVPNGKERRRIPERIRPGTDVRREEEKRGTRKSGIISSHGRVPGTFEKQQRRGVQRERHGEKQRVRGPLERNRDVNHSGYRRERKLGQSRQSRLHATESAVTLQLPTLVPKMQKFPMEWAVQPFDDPYADPLDLDMILDGEYVTEMVPGNFQFLKKGRAVGPALDLATTREYYV